MNIATVLRYAEIGKDWWKYRYYIMHDYLLMAEKLGVGLVAITNTNDFEKICENCDGLIITGSVTNVNPKYYGGADEPDVVDEYALDAALIKYFHERGKPIFGVCGGHQALNVYFGGTLKKLNDKIAHETSDNGPRHNINIKEGSFVYDVFNSNKANVNCFHGWEIGRLAPNLEAVATTDDGVIEAIESKRDKVFATQWHPERSFHDDWENSIEQKFFENFIKLCEESK